MNQTILVGKVSFDADSEHKLQDGVKVSLDLIVDQANELYASLPGAGSSKEYPFVQINIKHLNLQDGTGENVLPNDMGSYKDNVQLTIDENIHIQGIYLVKGFTNYCPTDIRVYATAKFDLAHEKVEENGTEIYAALQTKHLTSRELDETVIGGGMPFELSYTKGTLTLRTDSQVSIINAAGALDVGYDMLLAKPIGNLMDNLLSAESLKTYKQVFDDLYWLEKPEKDEKGTITKDGTWNKNFQGLQIKNFGVSNVIEMVKGLFNKPAAPETAPGTTSAEEESKGSIYNVIVYAVGLISSDKAGAFSLATKDGLLGTVGKVAQLLGLQKLTTTEQKEAEEEGQDPTTVTTTYDWTAEGLRTWAGVFVDKLLKGDMKLPIGGADILIVEGGESANFKEILDYTFQEILDALTLDFDFNNGIHWDLSLLLREDPEISITWTSDIQIGKHTPVKDIRERLLDDKIAIQKAIVEALDAANAGVEAAQERYDTSAAKKELDKADTDLTSAKNTFIGEKNSNFLWMKDLHKGYNTDTKVGNIPASYITLLVNYLWAKYQVEQGMAEESAITTALDNINNSVFVRGSYYAAGKTKDDVATKLDEMYDNYKTNVAPKQVAYDAAKATAESTYEYRAIAEAQAAVKAANTFKTNSDKRIKLYDERYMNDRSAERLEGVPKFTSGELFENEDAYQKALKAVLDAYETAFPEADNTSSYRAAVETYLKWRYGNETNSSYVPEASLKQNGTDPLHNIDNEKVSQDLLDAAYNAYKAANSCKVGFAGLSVAVTITNLYDAFVEEVNSYTVWFTMDWAEATKPAPAE